MEEFRSEEKFDKLEYLLKLYGQKVYDSLREIEVFNEDFQSVSETQKLSLEKIFEINSLLNQGCKISSIFNIEEIKDFLDIIFQKSKTVDG